MFQKNFLNNCFSAIYISVILLVSLQGANAQFPNFTNQVISSGWDQLEVVAFDSTGRLFAAEKGGKVWMVDTFGVKMITPILDISDEVGTWRDHGLNGFALDPDFLNNGFIYLFYTVDRHHLINFGTPSYNASANEYYQATISRVTRYTIDTANYSTIVSNSRHILIGEDKKSGIPVLFESHSGGDLIFGNDGSLLVTTGDGGSYTFVDNGGGATYWSQAIADSIIRPQENVGAFRSQMINCLNGKVLRVDPATGDGLDSNPFYDNSDPRSPRSRVYALGLRNPFRGTIKPGTGDPDITAGDPGVIYLGDVGWDNWEDINIITEPAQNFGWPLYEGLTPHLGYQNTDQQNFDTPNPLFNGTSCAEQYYRFEDLLIQDTPVISPDFSNSCDTLQQIADSITFIHRRPEIDYKHGYQTRAGIFIGDSAATINITDTLSPVQGTMFGGYASVGGLWYNDDRFPFEWQNTYFHADYVGQWIRSFVIDEMDKASEVKPFWDNNGNIVCMKLNPSNGCISYVAYPDLIKEICYTGIINNPPNALALSDTLFGYTPLHVNFNGSSSTDPENLPLTYFWEFGDGDTSSLPNPIHTYTDPASQGLTLYAKLTVTDDVGQISVDSVQISLNNTPPVVDITSLNDGDMYSMNGLSNFSLIANVSDAEHAPGQLSYSWQTILHHNSHQHIEASDTNKISSTVISPVGCVPFADYHFRIVLTVTDEGGLSTIDSVRVYAACDAPTANFTGSNQDICKYDSVSFMDLSTNFAIDWKWEFPGGSPSTSKLQNPVVQYSDVGEFDVKLIASSVRGSDTLILQDYITVKSLPQISITAPGNTNIVCAGSELKLTATSPNPIKSYQWSRWGVDISGATGSSYQVTKTGNYRVLVTKVNGCSKLSDKYRVNKKKLPVAHITANGPLAFCDGDSVILSATNNPGYTFQWKKYANDLSGDTTANLVVTKPGVYKAIVTDSIGCARASNKLVSNVIDCSNPSKEIFSTSGLGGRGFEIFPNPTNGPISLQFNQESSLQVMIEVLDMRGGVLVKELTHGLNVNSPDLRMDLSWLTPGVYMIRVTSKGEIQQALIIKN